MSKNNLTTTPELFIENVNLYYSTLLTRIGLAMEKDRMVLDKPTVQFHRDNLFNVIFNGNHVSIEQLQACSFKQLKSIGFVEWLEEKGEKLMLIPLRLRYVLDPEMVVTTINGETVSLKDVSVYTAYGAICAGIYIEHSDKE